MKILTNFTNSGINNSKRVCCEQIINECYISKYQFCLFEEKLCKASMTQGKCVSTFSLQDIAFEKIFVTSMYC